MAAIANIQLSTLIIGTITVDADRVCGEGGPHDARLVLPLVVTMYPQPVESTLALVELACILCLTLPVSDSTRVGLAVTVNPFRDMHCQSHPAAPTSERIEIRFPLSPALITQFETHRHSAADRAFGGYLRLRGGIAWMYQTGNSFPPTSTSIVGHPFESHVGIFSTLAWFHSTRIDDLSFRVPASTWIDSVLPGLGFNQLRLVELYLPASGGTLPDTIFSFLDAARQDYDQGYYQECIEKCRYVRNEVERYLNATRQRPVGDVLAQRRGWPSGSPQGAFLNTAWEGLVNLTNAAHHPPGGQRFSRADAHACFLLTALLLEYLVQP